MRFTRLTRFRSLFSILVRPIHLAALAGTMAVGMSSGCLDEALAACEGDAACPAGSVCAFSLCVDPAALGRVDVEVEPPNTSDFPTQSVFDVDTVDGARVDISLEPATSLAGQVVDSDGAAVAATVVANPERIIAGRVRQPRIPVDGGRYSLPVIRGQSYRLLALPDDPALPPTETSEPFEAGTDDPPVLIVSADIAVSGRITAGEGAASIAQTGMDVLVVDESGRRVSSLASIADDTEDGRFALTLSSGVEGTRLVIRPTVADGRPTVSLPIELTTPGEFDLGDLSLGIAARVQVAGKVRLASGAPAGVATLVLRGQVGAGTTTARTTADEDGNFRVNVYPGTYSVAAAAEGDDGGLLVTSLVVTEDQPALLFTLPARIPASLQVTTAEGSAVPLASVVLTRVGNVDGLAEPVLSTGAQPVFLGSADNNGAVILAVDPGRYRISIAPPRGTGAPVFSVVLTLVDDVERIIALPPATVMAGTLTGGQVGGAFVRVFSSVTDELGRAILLGEAISEPDGSFAVPLPDLGF